ncbi:MAG TPA: hypothetical protein VKR56_08010 [Candidatus Cybelea sp.]|nr:hypothetical protein [Candidatus Cybelea sp.]
MARVERLWPALLAVAMLAVSAAPARPHRHTVIGHFKVPKRGARRPVGYGANVVTNGGFESGNVDGGWHQCGDMRAYVTRDHPFSGAYDQYSGTANGRGEPTGNSGVCQEVTIPPGGVLTAKLYQLSDEADTTFAYQEADLLDNHGNVVVNLYTSVNDNRSWVSGTWNLGAFAGRTYWLYFGVHGDGYSKLSTQQFLDDVRLAGSALAPPK